MPIKMDLSGISFSYNSWPILDGITYQLSQSAFTGLIGPNGSGKSTLLKTMTRFLIPSAGELTLEGQDIHVYKHRELAKKIAVVPQDTALSFDFQVKDIILMGRTPHQRAFQGETQKDIAIMEEAMKETNTKNLAQRSFLDLSGGEKQRVIIARALCQEPEILLLDEPTSHLDINYQQEIFELLRRLNLQKDLTIIIVSHDLNLAAHYCNELILLKDGSIYAVGSPEEVITRENLEEVYGTNVLIQQDPSGRPHVFLQSFLQKQEQKQIHLHVICGGGSGAGLLEDLTTLGYQVSTGVLNRGDMDWKTAQYLGLTIVEEEAFAPISQQKLEKNLSVMDSAHTIILTGVPFGHGNLANLTALEQMAHQGKQILLFTKGQYQTRDYTGGEALEILKRLEKRFPIISDPKKIRLYLPTKKGGDPHGEGSAHPH